MSKAAELAALIGSGQAQTASNLIINGSNQIAQRSTSSTSSGYQTVDRTRAEFSGASVTQSQQALTSGGPYNDGHRFFFRCANTSTSSATSAYLQINQEIEAQNVATSGWDATSSSSFITMSFWARSSLAGTYNIHLRTHDGTARSFSTTFTLVADTWKKVTATIPGNSGITVTNDNGIGLRCYIIVHYGTNYTSSGHTSDAWQTVDTADLTADFAQNWSNTASATFDMTGWQLEVGQVSTPYPHEDIETTLAKCQRYFETVEWNSYVITGNSYSTAQANLGPIVWKVNKRANPTLTFPTIGTSSGTIGVTSANGNFITQGSAFLATTTVTSAQMYNAADAGFSGYTDDGVCMLFSYGGTTLKVDSEL
tara:strand:+ start:767 stop:1870 length:1104 start_codon:yes stop_codon:yes gene_type:complete